MLITKDMGIMEIVQKYPATVEVLQRFGMGCIGCAAAHFENIEQGALAHGIDVPRLMEALNEAAAKAEDLTGADAGGGWGRRPPAGTAGQRAKPAETVRRTVWPAA